MKKDQKFSIVDLVLNHDCQNKSAHCDLLWRIGHLPLMLSRTISWPFSACCTCWCERASSCSKLIALQCFCTFISCFFRVIGATGHTLIRLWSERAKKGCVVLIELHITLIMCCPISRHWPVGQFRTHFRGVHMPLALKYVDMLPSNCILACTWGKTLPSSKTL